MGLESIVSVAISRETAGITQAGFGTALILGENAEAGTIKTYTSLAAVAEDFDTDMPEYLMAAKLFSQQPRVRRIKIGDSDIAAQQETLTPVVGDDTLYTVGFGTGDEDGLFEFTSGTGATAAEIVEGLRRDIMGEELQLIEFDAVPTSGSFKLHFGTANVTVLSSDNAAAVQTKVRTLPGLSAAVVTGDYTSGFEVLFRGYAGDAPLLATSANVLLDTATPVVISVSVETEGENRVHGVVASGTATLILTAADAGQGFTYNPSANLNGVTTTPSGSIADAINAAVDLDNDWYFLLLTSAAEDVIADAAETVEAMSKIFVTRSDAAAVRTSATNDLASDLKDASYFRTALFYTGSLTDYPDAAFIGKLAPLDPGSETWAFKTLAGVTVDNWTDSEKGYLNGKNADYYVPLAGVNVTLNGKVAGGEYLDVIRFIDWLTARIQEEIFGNLVRQAKVPFTDKGIAVIESAVRAVLERGVKAGGIASSQDYTVTVPKSADVSANDKAARSLTGVHFTAVLAGAIHAVEIAGNVTL